ncbi:helix-turn-helix domain-containing protein [Luteipulveratus sp. YIM 133132]|uniref:Helix-turn-helix domain-containing protein n=1 Tax=Luteipulveratus flavus TaxID=3031728 RepID=A0ABT6C268_9MICO|nr:MULTISPECIES: helix-turn-helix domain-containing protein [unclassified Luteipulveratus]MDE9367014.1 helix-turn-helix domain-containing protein [Luteipulveratus sp. YIM 133132]MDF8262999.1 helix-turn-helix domain-containing protein [Luteipulveratus sp. YIM 133296]
MASSYGQFCPVAKAMEVLDERWTLLVVRELMLGSTHFNELRRGNPRMSPALLSKRLRTLERAGVIERRADGRHVTYVLTACGEELRPVVEALGAWGVRWVGYLGEADLDPHLLMFDVRRTLPTQEWPAGRTVVSLRFADVAAPVSRWWVCVTSGEVDICDYDPGFESAAHLETSLRTLTQVWRGDRSWADAVRSGALQVDAPADVRRRVAGWFGQSVFAAIPRPA